MTGLALWLAAMASMAPGARPPLPGLPVPLVPGDYGPCSTAEIANLRHGNTVSVRSEPSARSRMLDRLRNGRAVYACVRRGDWFGIVYEQGPRQTGCNVFEHPRRVNSVYIGPCRSGWVHERYLRGYADWVSP